MNLNKGIWLRWGGAIFICLLLFVSGGANAADIRDEAITTQTGMINPAEWNTDFELAKKIARQEKRPILAAFVGSGWHKRWKDLQPTLSHDFFREYAKENLVLLLLDFSKQKNPEPAKIAQMQCLKKKYYVGDMPTVLLLDADGKEISRIVERVCCGCPDQYVEVVKMRLEVVPKVEKQGDKKLIVLDEKNGWQTNFEKAEKSAKEQKKEMFVLKYDSSSWQGRLFNLEVVSQPAFTEFIRDNFVPVVVDMSNPSAREELDGNGIEELPSLEIVDTSGGRHILFHPQEGMVKYIQYLEGELKGIREDLKENAGKDAEHLAKAAKIKKDWYTDFAEAKKQAQKEHKMILAELQVSYPANEEVYSTEVFKKYAASKLVLFTLNAPKEMAKTKKWKKQLSEFIKEYEIERWPAALVLDENGKQLAEIPRYESGCGAEQYTEYLDDLVEDAKNPMPQNATDFKAKLKEADGWVFNLEGAKELAERKKLPIFVAVLDSSRASQRLIDQVLTQAEFKKCAGGNMILACETLSGEKESGYILPPYCSPSVLLFSPDGEQTDVLPYYADKTAGVWLSDLKKRVALAKKGVRNTERLSKMSEGNTP